MSLRSKRVPQELQVPAYLLLLPFIFCWSETFLVRSLVTKNEHERWSKSKYIIINTKLLTKNAMTFRSWRFNITNIKLLPFYFRVHRRFPFQHKRNDKA